MQNVLDCKYDWDNKSELLNKIFVADCYYVRMTREGYKE